MEITNDIIFKLTELGFSSYEAKAYYALLQKQPAIGYEVSKIAKVPTSKIYETLTNLINKGAVISSTSEPVYYSAIDPETILKTIKKEFVTKIEDLEVELKQVQPIPDIDITWNLTGFKIVMEKMIHVINNASNLLLLSLWPEDAAKLKEHIILAESRGVKIIIGIFGEFDVGCTGIINLESCGYTSKNRLGKRLNVVISDSKEVVLGEMGEKEDSVGIWATTPSIVLLAKEYIKHDIWGKYLVDIVGEEKFNQMCDSNEILSFLIHNR
ncbi:TrmB family transcriptional regulator [Bacillus sp. 03113]|uniref:TrmB family transcriptional regulator n=1 Tax=Bacillus sp. 03113 TaxID=2578211 RepID=UPI00114199E2|nr:TrmB family transcriptional regulator [Bacillus sp. 03113]